METSITWLVRYAHLLTGAVWCGGYACLALVIVPALQRERQPAIDRLALGVTRFLTYAGTLTLVFGLLLVTRTRGLRQSFQGGMRGLRLIPDGDRAAGHR
ncbi:MAG: hypothetical protein U0232_01840 [Thermomicrobiales bacterium]